MTLARWLIWRFARGALLALGLASLGLGLVALVEAGAGGRDPWVALLRAPLGLREALPALLGLSVALTLARLRERSDLLTLGAAGVSPARLQLLAALGVTLIGAPAALGLELATPTARDAAAEREPLEGGQSLSLAGCWAATERGLLRVGEAQADAVGELTLVETHEGALQRVLQAEGLRADGAAWQADSIVSIEITETGPARMGGDLSELPSPEALTRLARRGAPVEAGLMELRPQEAGWRRHRGAGLLSAPVVAWSVAGVGLVLVAPPAGVALVGGVLLGAWQLLSLALADTALSGWAPLALLLGVALLARLRPVAWGPHASADVAG